MDNPPKLVTEQWHERFQVQALWTAPVRRYLTQQLRLNEAKRILEVGCGTGVITTETQSQMPAVMHGVDISFPFLRKARESAAPIRYTCGDAFHLPYQPQCFDACICHFLLLWLNDPSTALVEMLRVTKKDGYLVIMAEPDYASRIDYPPELEQIGVLQREALKDQGANPDIGRESAHLLVETGCANVRFGLLGGQWGSPLEKNQFVSEWDTIKADLEGNLPVETLQALMQIDHDAWQRGERILFVPTFYAWGQVK